MKKNLFDIDNDSLNVNGLHPLKACEPCSSDVEKIKRKINNRKLSDIKDDEVLNILTPFKY